jgi:hypothetical protein
VWLAYSSDSAVFIDTRGDHISCSVRLAWNDIYMYVGPKSAVFWDVFAAVAMKKASWDIASCGSS